MHSLLSANLNVLTSPIAALCVRIESGELTWRQAHDALVARNVRRVSALFDPDAREDLAALLRALPLAEAFSTYLPGLTHLFCVTEPRRKQVGRIG